MYLNFPALLVAHTMHAALVKMGATADDADEVIPMSQLDPGTQARIGI